MPIFYSRTSTRPSDIRSDTRAPSKSSSDTVSHSAPKLFWQSASVPPKKRLMGSTLAVVFEKVGPGRRGGAGGYRPNKDSMTPIPIFRFRLLHHLGRPMAHAISPGREGSGQGQGRGNLSNLQDPARGGMIIPLRKKKSLAALDFNPLGGRALARQTGTIKAFAPRPAESLGKTPRYQSEASLSGCKKKNRNNWGCDNPVCGSVGRSHTNPPQAESRRVSRWGAGRLNQNCSSNLSETRTTFC